MSAEIRPGIRRLLRFITPRSAARDADDEIRLHLTLRTKQLIAEGMSPAAAQEEAERRFGEIGDERRQFRNAARRRERRTRWRDWLDATRADLRYAFRTLRRDAGFTSFAVAIVALGIGASATVFSLVDGVVLRPMPFRDPSRLVWIPNIGDNGKDEWRLQVGHFRDVAARSQSLADMAGYFAYYSIGDAILSAHGETQRLTRVPVTCNFIPFLGVSPELGRSFSADECIDNGAPTTILTDKVWREHFGADHNIVGKAITLNEQPVTVIGVLPPSFDFSSVFTPGAAADLFVPYALSENNNRRGNTLATIGRLKPGVSIERANTGARRPRKAADRGVSAAEYAPAACRVARRARERSLSTGASRACLRRGGGDADRRAESRELAVGADDRARARTCGAAGARCVARADHSPDADGKHRPRRRWRAARRGDGIRRDEVRVAPTRVRHSTPVTRHGQRRGARGGDGRRGGHRCGRRRRAGIAVAV